MNTVGLILMGGQNTRMGGVKKALLSYNGKSFYEHIRQAMMEAGLEHILASVEAHWQELSVPQLIDQYKQIGPLGGIVTALETILGQTNADSILVVPCDVPRVSAPVLQELLRRFRESRLPVVLFADGRPNPLIAVYTKDCLPVLKQQIAQGNYRATHWINYVTHVRLELTGAEDGEYYLFTDADGKMQQLPVNTIANINSKEDYISM